MNESNIITTPITRFDLWQKAKKKRSPLSFTIELTDRCNNNCRHCYINLPAGDLAAKQKELSLKAIKKIADEAVSLGTLWCLLTGGEPLIRSDFQDIYIYLKKKGLLVSVFTNATLITHDHIKLFKKYPPRNIEVTCYGITKKTYEKVSRIQGSYSKFKRGLGLLLKSGLSVTLKAMVLRSNVEEFSRIAEFCRKRSIRSFRFDPFLHLRFDGDTNRNQDIISERLSPDEIAALELSDPDRFQTLKQNCGKLISPEFANITDNHLFRCSPGQNSFIISSNGIFRLCSSLWHPDCMYNLVDISLKAAWLNLAPKIWGMRSNRHEFLEKCRKCPIINLCMWCPANAYLETKELDKHVDYFCKTAHAKVNLLKKRNKMQSEF